MGWDRGGNTSHDTTIRKRHEFRGFRLGKIWVWLNSGHLKIDTKKTGRVRVGPVEPEYDTFF